LERAPASLPAERPRARSFAEEALSQRKSDARVVRPAPRRRPKPTARSTKRGRSWRGWTRREGSTSRMPRQRSIPARSLRGRWPAPPVWVRIGTARWSDAAKFCNKCGEGLPPRGARFCSDAGRPRRRERRKRRERRTVDADRPSPSHGRVPLLCRAGIDADRASYQRARKRVPPRLGQQRQVRADEREPDEASRKGACPAQPAAHG
jgi:hypothetical protein